MDRHASAKKTRLDQQFSDHEEEIRQIYSREDKTLKETMGFFEQRRGLKARYEHCSDDMTLRRSNLISDQA